MNKVQVINPYSGHYELYSEDGELLSRQEELHEGVPVIGRSWKPDTPEAKAVIEQMGEELAEINQQMNRLKELGFTMELMEIFIYKKSNVNLREIRKVLQSQQDFFDEAFKPINE